MLPIVAALSIVYGAFWIAQGRIDSDSFYSLLILFGVVALCGVIGALRKPRLRVANVHRKLELRRRRMRTDDFMAFDHTDVERLRREWRVDVYDPGYSARHEMSPSGHRDDIHDHVINPATGLPMVGGIGGFDVSGHTFGTGFEHDSLNHWHREDDTATRSWDDHRSGEVHFKSWD